MVNIWTPLLEKTDVNDQEARRLTVGIHLAKTPPEVHGEWKGDQLRSNTITEAWVEARELLSELWMKDTVMTDMDRKTEEEDFASHSFFISTKKICFKDK